MAHPSIFLQRSEDLTSSKPYQTFPLFLELLASSLRVTTGLSLFVDVVRRLYLFNLLCLRRLSIISFEHGIECVRPLRPDPIRLQQS